MSSRQLEVLRAAKTLKRESVEDDGNDVESYSDNDNDKEVDWSELNYSSSDTEEEEDGDDGGCFNEQNEHQRECDRDRASPSSTSAVKCNMVSGSHSSKLSKKKQVSLDEDIDDIISSMSSTVGNDSDPPPTSSSTPSAFHSELFRSCFPSIQLPSCLMRHPATNTSKIGKSGRNASIRSVFKSSFFTSFSLKLPPNQVPVDDFVLESPELLIKHVTYNPYCTTSLEVLRDALSKFNPDMRKRVPPVASPHTGHTPPSPVDCAPMAKEGESNVGQHIYT